MQDWISHKTEQELSKISNVKILIVEVKLKNAHTAINVAASILTTYVNMHTQHSQQKS
jgi:hypothetical protein